jgi:hypothetical protein
MEHLHEESLNRVETGCEYIERLRTHNVSRNNGDASSQRCWHVSGAPPASSLSA